METRRWCTSNRFCGNRRANPFTGAVPKWALEPVVHVTMEKVDLSNLDRIGTIIQYPAVEMEWMPPRFVTFRKQSRVRRHHV
jgi:hypothetical protein